ncbi:cholesterol 24-hydroxylase-like isoform X3 [Montipora foliosa]|uniref:cholesterol 24-hydroxylase-like isoform X3 n=1 Tax=Montipora foliosa TaxID=591990 RepID=UPI0035F1A42F
MFTLFLYVFVAIGFLLGTLVLSYAAFVSRKRQRWSHIPSPPMPSFFKGHADEFLRIREQDLPVGQIFLEWCTQYGKILVVWFWHNPVLLVADSDAIKVN